MAQWSKNIQDYLNQERTLHEVYLRADEYGNILNEGACSKSAFGENIAIPITPKIQGDAVYGLDPREFQTFKFLTVELQHMQIHLSELVLEQMQTPMV